MENVDIVRQHARALIEQSGDERTHQVNQVCARMGAACAGMVFVIASTGLYVQRLAHAAMQSGASAERVMDLLNYGMHEAMAVPMMVGSGAFLALRAVVVWRKRASERAFLMAAAAVQK